VQKIDSTTKDLGHRHRRVKAVEPDDVVFVSLQRDGAEHGMITQLTPPASAERSCGSPARTPRLTAGAPPGALTNVNGLLRGLQPTAYFTSRVAAVAPAVTDLLFAEEAYDATILAALAATVAKDAHGAAIAGHLREVSAGESSAPRTASVSTSWRPPPTSTTNLTGRHHFDFANGDTRVPPTFILYRLTSPDASRGWATSSPAEVVSAADSGRQRENGADRPENDLNVTESNDRAVLRGCNTHVL
jgi:hypothetical protein